MTLTKEQEALVRAWAAEGASLSDIQTRLATECEIHLSYLDTRFLMLDLGVELAERNPPKAEPPPPPQPQAGPFAAAQPAADPLAAPPMGYDSPDAAMDPSADELPAGSEEALPDELPADDAPPAAGAVTVEISRIQRPGFALSGTLTCSDGVTGEWGVLGDGRLALDFGEANKGYRPSEADLRAFQQQLREKLSAAY